MEPLPKKPKSSLTRKISVAWSSISDDAEEWNGRRPAGRTRTEEAKQGRERSAVAEIVPRPSEDVDDPLNWPQWKKETAFGSLCLSTASVCILKTLYVTTNSVIATQYNASYIAAAALTGLPFIIAAMSSLVSTILAQVIGKRIIYLISGVMMLVGVLWNLHVMESYSWFMVSRVIQAVGWGATEGLILISIRDIFFVHERGLRTITYNIISLIFTWGSPILGGYISQSTAGFRNQLLVVNVIQAVAVLFLVLLVPETSFNRSISCSQSRNPVSTFTTTTVVTASPPAVSPIKSYLKSIHPVKYTAAFSLQDALKPVRALCAPSTLLTFLLTGPLVASAYGVANSLSLLFAAMPTFLFPSRLGYIFILPVVLSLIFYTTTSYISYLHNRPPHHLTPKSDLGHLVAAIPGSVLGATGLLGFGLYIAGELSRKTNEAASDFSLDVTGLDLSLKIVSLLFGLLVAATTVLSFATASHLALLPNKSSSLVTDQAESPLLPAHNILQNILNGIFIISFPLWVRGTEGIMEGLKNTVIAITLLQLVLASAVGAVLFFKVESIRKIDQRVLGVGMAEVMDSQQLKTGGSFWDA